MREKMSKQLWPAPTASTVGPCPTFIQIDRMLQRWEFTQYHSTTQPPPPWNEYMIYRVPTIIANFRKKAYHQHWNMLSPHIRNILLS